MGIQKLLLNKSKAPWVYGPPAHPERSETLRRWAQAVITLKNPGLAFVWGTKCWREARNCTFKYAPRYKCTCRTNKRNMENMRSICWILRVTVNVREIPLKEGKLYELKVIPGAPERELDHGGVVLMKPRRWGTRSWICMNSYILQRLREFHLVLHHFGVFTHFGECFSVGGDLTFGPFTRPLGWSWVIDEPISSTTPPPMSLPVLRVKWLKQSGGWRQLESPGRRPRVMWHSGNKRRWMEDGNTGSELHLSLGERKCTPLLQTGEEPN